MKLSLSLSLVLTGLATLAVAQGPYKVLKTAKVGGDDHEMMHSTSGDGTCD